MEGLRRRGVNPLYANRRKVEAIVFAQIDRTPTARVVRNVIVVEIPAMVINKLAVPRLELKIEEIFPVAASGVEEDNSQSVLLIVRSKRPLGG